MEMVYLDVGCDTLGKNRSSIKRMVAVISLNFAFIAAKCAATLLWKVTVGIILLLSPSADMFDLIVFFSLLCQSFDFFLYSGSVFGREG